MSSASPPPVPQMHKSIKSLEPFLGVWRGEGLGFYPTIKVFNYGEEATFTTWGKPIVGYSHRTWNLETKAPMHYESGYFRIVGDGRIEFINAQPTGITEIDEGVFNAEKRSIELNSRNISRSSSAKEPHVTQTKRIFQLRDDNTLAIFFDMATTNQPLQRHLEAELKRVG